MTFDFVSESSGALPSLDQTTSHKLPGVEASKSTERIVALDLALSSTGLDEQNIAILNDVIFALGHDLTLGLDRRFITLFPQSLVVVHDRLDEGLLKVAVNDTGSLRSLGAISDRPLPDLVRTSCEEAAEVEGLAHGGDDLGQRRLGSDSLAFLGGLLLSHCTKALLERHGHGNDWVALGVFLHPLSDLGKVLVLLADVVLLTEVDKVDDRLCGKEEKRVDVFNL